MSEPELQKHVRAACRRLGLLYWHAHDARRAPAGFPDCVVVGSRVLWRELKSASGALSPDQVRWRYALVAAGADWKLWRPADWPDVIVGELLARGSATSAEFTRSASCFDQPAPPLMPPVPITDHLPARQRSIST